MFDQTFTPLYARVASDIHLDFDVMRFRNNKFPIKDGRQLEEYEVQWMPEPMPEDIRSVLILPGDIWLYNKAFERRFNLKTSWLEQVAARFHAVVLVLGNHDYWGGSLNRAPLKALEGIKALGLDNVFLLERSQVVLGDLKILGGTLWTNYNRGNPTVMMTAQNFTKDYDRIRVGLNRPGRKSRPQDMYDVHRETWRYISNHARRDHEGQKVIVLTHMAPSFGSISPMYHTSSDMYNNYSYFSDLEKGIHQPEFQADFWLHGHCHNASDYVIDRTRVLCNPRGYVSYEFGHEQTGFDPWLRIDLASLEVEKTPDLTPV
jgi:predicted phosphohydrolase